MAAKKLTPEELNDVIPIAFPMTHNFEGCELITKYPVDHWEEAGAPYLSARSWCKLAMRAAKQDNSNLEAIFETAQKLLPKCPGDCLRDSELVSDASGSAATGPASSV